MKKTWHPSALPVNRAWTSAGESTTIPSVGPEAAAGGAIDLEPAVESLDPVLDLTTLRAICA
jgi:hypothetical protein